MPKLRTRTVIGAAALAATAPFLVGVGPADAAGNQKCDTDSPLVNVKICVRTNASKQTDGSGYRMDNVRVWAEGAVGDLEDCTSFVARVEIKKQDGTTIDTRAGSACRFTDYSHTFDFGGSKFPDNAYVVVYAQMYRDHDVDPPQSKVSLPAVD